MAEAIHEILGGKVQLYRRPNSTKWQCRASVGCQQLRHSTKVESLAQAKDIAEDWYLTIKGKAVRGEPTKGPTFADAAKRFMTEFKVITAGQRSEKYKRLDAQAARDENAADYAAWIRWATNQADRLDPLSKSPPSILDTPRDACREPGMNEHIDDDGNIADA